MPTKYVVTLVSTGSSSVISIPKPVVDGFNLQKGTKLEMWVFGGGIVLPLRSEMGEGNEFFEHLSNLAEFPKSPTKPQKGSKGAECGTLHSRAAIATSKPNIAIQSVLVPTADDYYEEAPERKVKTKTSRQKDRLG